MLMEKARKQLDLDRLRQEHRALDDLIAQMEGRRHLTPSEASEVKRLKRLKLYKKDEIAALARGQL
jgi:uncharacterized protein YdcH (DUF465 family)